jgi:hypothetical protein
LVLILWAYGVNTGHVDIIPCGRRIGHQRFVLLVGVLLVGVAVVFLSASTAPGARPRTYQAPNPSEAVTSRAAASWAVRRRVGEVIEPFEVANSP